jgi:hypothetical protein
VGALALAQGGCAGAGRSPGSAPAGAPGLSRTMVALPGTLPTRRCSDNIYAGGNAAAVVRTPDDVVVGPVRLSTLRQATGAGLYRFATADGPATGFKSPLSVSGTTSRWIALRVTGDGGRVKVSYDPASFVGGTPGDPKQGRTVVAVQTAVACGNGAAGFVQYNGGFTWLHATCATLQVFDQKGRLVAAKVVPFGLKKCG